MMIKKFSILVSFIFLVSFVISCANSYTTTSRHEAENIIHAPIEIVWGKTLTILPSERISILTVDDANYFVTGRKRMTLWSWGDNISVRLIPKDEKKTIMHFGAEADSQLIDWGHNKRMTEYIFNRIKTASENEATP